MTKNCWWENVKLKENKSIFIKSDVRVGLMFPISCQKQNTYCDITDWGCLRNAPLSLRPHITEEMTQQAMSSNV